MQLMFLPSPSLARIKWQDIPHIAIRQVGCRNWRREQEPIPGIGSQELRHNFFVSNYPHWSELNILIIRIWVTRTSVIRTHCQKKQSAIRDMSFNFTSSRNLRAMLHRALSWSKTVTSSMAALNWSRLTSSTYSEETEKLFRDTRGRWLYNERQRQCHLQFLWPNPITYIFCLSLYGIQKMTFAILALIPRSSHELLAKLRVPALVRSLQNLTEVSLRHPSDVHILKIC